MANKALIEAVEWVTASKHQAGCACQKCENARRLILDAGMVAKVYGER